MRMKWLGLALITAAHIGCVDVDLNRFSDGEQVELADVVGLNEVVVKKFVGGRVDPKAEPIRVRLAGVGDHVGIKRGDVTTIEVENWLRLQRGRRFQVSGDDLIPSREFGEAVYLTPVDKLDLGGGFPERFLYFDTLNEHLVGRGAAVAPYPFTRRDLFIRRFLEKQEAVDLGRP